MFLATECLSNLSRVLKIGRVCAYYFKTYFIRLLLNEDFSCLPLPLASSSIYLPMTWWWWWWSRSCTVVDHSSSWWSAWSMFTQWYDDVNFKTWFLLITWWWMIKKGCCHCLQCECQWPGLNHPNLQRNFCNSLQLDLEQLKPEKILNMVEDTWLYICRCRTFCFVQVRGLWRITWDNWFDFSIYTAGCQAKCATSTILI
jgi:hypothetical protein